MCHVYIWSKIGGYDDSYSKQSTWYYFASYPHYGQERNEGDEIPDSIRGKAFYDEIDGWFYLRVTKEQYDELMSNFMKAAELSRNNIEDVTYTYDELFGEFSGAATIIEH